MIGDWYVRDMYVEGSKCYQYHLEHYGHPSEFGYKDIIALWKAENFDPDRLMAMYKKMGAKFFVTMGVHHDNFDLWNSKYHWWNAVNIGPKRDIVGEWKKAAEKYGLRFGISEHLERAYCWFSTNKGCDKEGKWKGVPYDGSDPQYRELYLDGSLEDTSYGYPKNPSDPFVENYYWRLKDLIETYSPDWLYTDGGIGFGSTGLAMVANYYNHNMKMHNGKLEAVYAYKNFQPPEVYHGDYREGAGILDLERTLSGGIREKPWQTDTCIGNWFYNRDFPYKSVLTVIQMLADVVSKNGTFLLSVPLKPDGTIDEREEKIVNEISEWMEHNGEAIYDTRPFTHYGEGPQTEKADVSPVHDGVDCTPDDVRFTVKGNVLYAIRMGQAPQKQLVLHTLAPLQENVLSIQTLDGKECRWKYTDGTLTIAYESAPTAVGMDVVKIICKESPLSIG